MRPIFRSMVGLILASMLACVGCKREEAKVPTIRRAPPMTGPTSRSAEEEGRKKLRESVDPIPPLSQGVLRQTPDGEFWTAYPNGLMIHDLKRGEGIEPRWGQTLTVTYVGTFPGQSKPFEQRGADKPMSFPLGSKTMVSGMSMGISTMHVGGKRRIFLPPDLAYGSLGNLGTNIGPNQALIFEVELLDATGEWLEEPKEDARKIEPLGPPAPTPGMPGTAPAPSAPATTH